MNSTTRAPKTRRIALGLMQFNQSKKFVTVRYAKGGGSRTLDVPVNATKQELIERHEKPFTIPGYFESYKLTRVQLYLTCQLCEDSDDEVLMTNVFGPSTSNTQSSTTPQNKDKSWCQQLHAQLENNRKLWTKLKMEQDEEHQKCLEMDRKKQAALEGEIAEVTKLEELRSAKAARVPDEPESGCSRVLMVTQHLFQRRVTQFFSATEKMVAVLDWLGSLDLHPEHFSLQVHPTTIISPDEGVLGYEGVVMYMRAWEEPLLMGTSSPEISFIGFGTGTCHDEIATDDHDCETFPQQIMKLDEERYPKSFVSVLQIMNFALLLNVP